MSIVRPVSVMIVVGFFGAPAFITDADARIQIAD